MEKRDPVLTSGLQVCMHIHESVNTHKYMHTCILTIITQAHKHMHNVIFESLLP